MNKHHQHGSTTRVEFNQGHQRICVAKGFVGDNSGGGNRWGEFVQCGGKAKDSLHGQAENSDPVVSVTIGATCKYIRCAYIEPICSIVQY